MVSIVGKNCLIVLIFGMSVCLGAASIELKVKSLEGAPMAQAGVGVPFLVEVTASGRDISQKPHIAGLDAFQVQTAGMRVFTVNGDASTSHTYKVRIDQPGSFVIGPATLSINGTRTQSKAVRILVGSSQTIDPEFAKRTQADTSHAQVKLTLDKSHAFVGESVVCTLTFMGKKDAVKLEQIEEPKFSECNVGVKTGPVVGTQTINGTEYTTATWSWQLFPKKAGTLIIPASGADYQTEQEVRDNLSFFSPFFRFRAERKRTYSNACTLTVDPLPDIQRDVQAVGLFKSFQASIKPSVAQEGEGMVLLLELEGDADLARLDTIKLERMPSALKWYDSKQSTVE